MLVIGIGITKAFSSLRTVRGQGCGTSAGPSAQDPSIYLPRAQSMRAGTLRTQTEVKRRPQVTPQLANTLTRFLFNIPLEATV